MFQHERLIWRTGSAVPAEILILSLKYQVLIAAGQYQRHDEQAGNGCYTKPNNELVHTFTLPVRVRPPGPPEPADRRTAVLSAAVAVNIAILA
jgi:hypothetical protein